MNEPKRMLGDGSVNAFQRELLGSFADERPSAEAREKTLAALGLTALTASTMTTAAGASGVTGATSATAKGAAGSIAPKAIAASTTWLGAWIKWGIAGVALLGSVGGAVGYAYRDARSVEHARPSISPSMAQPSSPASTANVVSAAGSAVGPSSLEIAPPAMSATSATSATSAMSAASGASGVNSARAFTASAPTPPRAAASNAGSLGAQLSAIDRAREALDAGDPGAALSRIDDYEARFKGGAFTQEAEVLRVQALLARGDRAGAERVGARFLAAYPRSPHAARVRALIDRVGPTP